MLRAMLKKESQELAIPFLLALGAFALLTGDQLLQANLRRTPRGEWLLDDDVVYAFLFISLCLSIAIGLVQCVAEDIQGTWRYVLSFPGGWRRILKLKMACAAIIWLVWMTLSVGGSLFLKDLTRGSTGPPAFQLVDPMLRSLVSLPLVYLGTLLSAVRSARWLGSRLMPLGGTLGIWYLMLYLPNWWIVAPIAMTAFAAVLIGTMFHVASERDFA